MQDGDAPAGHSEYSVSEALRYGAFGFGISLYVWDASASEWTASGYGILFYHGSRFSLWVWQLEGTGHHQQGMYPAGCRERPSCQTAGGEADPGAGRAVWGRDPYTGHAQYGYCLCGYPGEPVRRKGSRPYAAKGSGNVYPAEGLIWLEGQNSQSTGEMTASLKTASAEGWKKRRKTGIRGEDNGCNLHQGFEKRFKKRDGWQQIRAYAWGHVYLRCACHALWVWPGESHAGRSSAWLRQMYAECKEAENGGEASSGDQQPGA